MNPEINVFLPLYLLALVCLVVFVCRQRKMNKENLQRCRNLIADAYDHVEILESLERRRRIDVGTTSGFRGWIRCHKEEASRASNRLYICNIFRLKRLEEELVSHTNHTRQLIVSICR